MNTKRIDAVVKRKTLPRQVILLGETATLNDVKDNPVLNRSLNPKEGVFWYSNWSNSILFPDSAIEALIARGEALPVTPNLLTSFSQELLAEKREKIEALKGTRFDHSTSPKDVDYGFDAGIDKALTVLGEEK